MLQVTTPRRSFVGLTLFLLASACAEDAASVSTTDTGLPAGQSDASQGSDSGLGGDAAQIGDGGLDAALASDGGALADGARGAGDSAAPDAAFAPMGIGPAPVRLGSAGNYVVLAKSAITNVPTSAVTGDVGLSPAAASYITGFSLTRVGTYWTAPEVTGKLFAADNDPGTPTSLTTAVADMETAYTDAAGRPTPTFLDVGAGTIGGMTLAPGLYKWNSSVTIPTDLTIAGAPNDTWIFQISGDLAISAAKRVTLSGGARAKNIVWQVAGTVDLGTTAHFEGVVLSQTAMTLNTGASINGRLLAQTAVNLAGATVVAPAP